MLKVIYWQYRSRYVDEIESLNEIHSYEDKCFEGILYYDCTVDQNNIVVHANNVSNYVVGELYNFK